MLGLKLIHAGKRDFYQHRLSLIILVTTGVFFTPVIQTQGSRHRGLWWRPVLADPAAADHSRTPVDTRLPNAWPADTNRAQGDCNNITDCSHDYSQQYFRNFVEGLLSTLPVVTKAIHMSTNHLQMQGVNLGKCFSAKKSASSSGTMDWWYYWQNIL